jgi:hypothetical protein
VYYFEFTEPNTTFDIPNDKNVIGGHADSYDVDELDGTPCANVPDSAGAGSTGSGVEWIFGGTSKLLINGANVELTTRTPTAGDPRINIYAVDVAQDLYLAETPGTIVVDAKNPSAKFTAHGMAYGPTANFEIFASKNTLAAFQNGIVANDLLVKPSEPGVGLSISVDVAEHTRTVLLTATARSNGESDFVVDARVEIRDDTLPPTMVVQSWRTCSIPAPSDPLLFPMPACP